MLRFCANVTALYPGLGLGPALQAGAAGGFDADELRAPYGGAPMSPPSGWGRLMGAFGLRPHAQHAVELAPCAA